MDEPVFFSEDTSEVATHFDVPDKHQYIGSIAEGQIPAAMPTIYFDYAVARRLQAEGQRSIKVDLEVAGILLGTRSSDSGIIKVSHIAVAKDEDSSPVHFKFSYSVWDDLIDQMEELSQKAGEELLLLGWYHTHPNMAVFLSRYDLRTHRDFARPYQFALVLAPKVGTDTTAVGFFCNRGDGTPLLPGIRLFDVAARDDVARTLPWRFQDLEVEGVYEGEGESADREEATEDQEPELAQLGVVRMEDPDWLTLGEDPSEGPVLPILESMAASVVETRQDRIGVLLGTKTKDNHITINRVRFLGTMGAGDKERADILVALRFMAESFPAHHEQKILGVARIVSPHRFRRGDAYDPIENNIRIALLLGEVGYDLDQVPFQVGIALYPGIEDDTIYFQVFAQHKTSRPVPLMSMRALAPPAMRANERYEPVDGPIFNVDDEPCHRPPAYGSQKKAKDDAAKKPGVSAPEPGARGDYADPATTGLDWAAVEEESRAAARRGVPLLLVGLGAVALALLVVVLMVRSKGGAKAPGDVVGDAATPVQIDGEPYQYSLTGCGAGWNPTRPCAPMKPSSKPSDLAELVRVQRLAAYDAATFEPLDAWLLPKASQDRPKVRLERTGEGEFWVFSVHRGDPRWSDFWGDGEPFLVTLVLLPRGAELSGADEWAPLRRTQELLLRGLSVATEGEDAPGDAHGGAPSESIPVVESGAQSYVWNANGGAEFDALYDRERRQFSAPLYAEGKGDGRGVWTVQVLDSGKGGVLGGGSSDSVRRQGARLDVAPMLQSVLREPKLSALLTKVQGDPPLVRLVITPPDGSAPLRLGVALRGEGGTTAVKHRVCVMARRQDGKKLLGTAVGEAASNVVGDFSINPAEGGRTFSERDAFGEGGCGDANGSRWADVEFTADPMVFSFRYSGTDDTIKVRVPVKTKLRDRSMYEPGAGACFTLTVTLDENGNQALAPAVTMKGRLVDGRCP